MNQFKAIIYDMDGLLIDSMIYWLEDTRSFLARRGIEMTPEMVKFFTGKGAQESMKWLKSEFNLPETVEELCQDKHRRIGEVYTELCQLLPGADSLIKTAARAGLKQAIASGAPLTAVDAIVKRFKWADYLNEWVSVEQVGHIGKPDPRVFLHAAELLKIKPEHCVVLEDAENGVIAAKAAGMKCVAVPNERWSLGDFSGADLVVDSLEDDEVLRYLDFLSVQPN